MGRMDDSLASELADLEARGLRRSMLAIERAGGTHVTLAGRRCVNFSSNDYLNLSDHPRVRSAASRALDLCGLGSPSSRMISGNLGVHEALEEMIGAWKRRRIVLFPTGYMANIGLLDSIADRGDAIYSDELNHESIIDGCRISRASTFKYPHRDAIALDRMMAEGGPYRRRIIVTDAVFSMDGDVAPLAELRDVADRRGAWLVADEAHSTGVLGATGRGIEEEFGLEGALDASVGTLGKALGGAGGYVAGSATLVDLLRNKARTFVYTTALPPPLCAGLFEAFAILTENPGMAAQVREKARLLRGMLSARGIAALPGDTPILPVVAGASAAAVECAARLRSEGYLVAGIRPPTVPEGSARLRISVNLGHTREEMEGLASALAKALPPRNR